MTKEPKMIVAGHISLDITPAFPDGRGGRNSLSDWIRPGKLVDVGKAALSAGGCVTNTGLALHKFGADVTLMGKIGADGFGGQIAEIYRGYGAKERLIVSKEDTTSYTIVIAPPGCDRCFLHDSAANHTLKSTDFDYGEIAEAQYFHFGYPQIMKGFYRDGGSELVRMYRKVKELGLVTSMDAVAIDAEGEAAKEDWGEILGKVLPYVDFFVPSAEELCFMLDRPRYEEWQRRCGGGDVCLHLSLTRDVKPLAQKALSLGCRAVMLKCGAAGMYLATRKEAEMKAIAPFFDGNGWGDCALFQNSFLPDRILSGTGAGDTSIAAFLYGVSHGFSPAECLSVAAGTGASCITEYDTLSGLLPLPELLEKIRGGWRQQKLILE